VDDALAALRGLKDEGAHDPILFLGPAGAVCFDRGRTTHVPIRASEVRDPSGVDDAFKGALAALLAEGLEVAEAVDGACGYASLALAVEGGRSAFPDRAAFDASRPED
jgi:ribokinase